MRTGAVGIVVVASVILTVAIYAGAILYFTWPISVLSVEKSGVFGDSFGLLTALFSGLAFAGLILTILLQREELSLQRTELRLTREEMRSQNFEATFFQMLRLHNDILGSIDLRNQRNGVQHVTTGRDCFMVFFDRLKSKLRFLAQQGKDPSDISTVRRAYAEFWQDNQHELGHYYRYLYRIFKLVDQSGVVDKSLYWGIVRAQLSNQELLLLYYDGVSEYGGRTFGRIAEHYSLFGDLDSGLLMYPAHANFYTATAWGNGFGSPSEESPLICRSGSE